jgi:Ser/Thr protein kinase RdoA (MazF antagonist)
MENIFKATINIEPWMKEQEVKFRQEAKANLVLAAQNGLLPEQAIDLDHLELFSRGSRSVVFCLNLGKENPYIVKMGTAKETIEAEPHFLESWGKAGIRVPKILGKHMADKKTPISFTTMEYIDAPLLSDSMDTKERISSAISRTSGEILAKLHKLTSHGFGNAIAGANVHGKFATFQEEIKDNLFEEKLPKMLEAGILQEAIYAPLNKALAFLDDEMKTGKKPSFTHNDFRPYNLFYKDGEIIVFDPNPKITHPMMCLASTLIKSRIEAESEKVGLEEESEILIGYNSITPIDEKSLNAALMIRSLMTLHIWWKKDQTEKMEKLKKLIQKYEINI